MIAGEAFSFADLLCKSLDFCNAKMQINFSINLHLMKSNLVRYFIRIEIYFNSINKIIWNIANVPNTIYRTEQKCHFCDLYTDNKNSTSKNRTYILPLPLGNSKTIELWWTESLMLELNQHSRITKPMFYR
jgi:hypothetical protein